MDLSINGAGKLDIYIQKKIEVGPLSHTIYKN
jgi:hypothetical protein